MSLFQNLSSEGLEETGDRLGGFSVLDTDIYLATIKAAYANFAANSKAMAVMVIADFEGREYRENFWVTNKDGQNFYHPKNKDGKADTSKRNPLPGFSHIEDLCMVTTDKPLNQQATEDKVMNVWDPEQKKELPKSVPMLVELLGKQAYFAVFKDLKNKQVKDSAGHYQDTADTREENVTEKIFHYPSKMTVTEAKKGLDPVFFDEWKNKHGGKTRDRRNIKDGEQNGRSGRPGTPPQAGNGGGQQRTTSLFSK